VPRRRGALSVEPSVDLASFSAWSRALFAPAPQRHPSASRERRDEAHTNATCEPFRHTAPARSLARRSGADGAADVDTCLRLSVRRLLDVDKDDLKERRSWTMLTDHARF
jgi:hypothetical protein